MRAWQVLLMGLFAVLALLDLADVMEIAAWRAEYLATTPGIQPQIDASLVLLLASFAAATTALFAFSHRFVAAAALTVWAGARTIAIWWAIEYQRYWDAAGSTGSAGFVPTTMATAVLFIIAAALAWSRRSAWLALWVAAAGFVARAAAYEMRLGGDAMWRAHIWVLFGGLAVLAGLGALAAKRPDPRLANAAGIVAAGIVAWLPIHIWLTVVNNHVQQGALVIDQAAGVAAFAVLTTAGVLVVLGLRRGADPRPLNVID